MTLNVYVSIINKTIQNNAMVWTIKLVGVMLLHLLLFSLSQTNNSFRLNTLRAHLQMTTIWLNYLESHPPNGFNIT